MRLRIPGIIDRHAEMSSGCLVSRSSALNVAASATVTVVFDSVTYDLSSEYSTSTGRFTSRNGGLYNVSGSILYDNSAWPAASRVDALLCKNGASFCGELQVVAAAVSQFLCCSVNGTILLAPGDYVTFVTTNYTVSARDIYITAPIWTRMNVTHQKV